MKKYFHSLADRCTSRQYTSKMTKKQLAACYTLQRERWINRPKKQSFTNHHWVHVVMNEEEWKEEKTKVHIKKIIPKHQFKNVTKVIANLKSRVNVTNVLGVHSQKF